tara:strand:- start:694 stop:1887 length:1194 start_codon:yes stop_codon:yes gene_type:complete
MEVDVKESNAVTAGAAAADKSLPKAGSNAAGVSTPGNSGSWEDLGGPTPENYKVDDDSAKLKTPGATLKQVKDVVNKGAKSGVKSGDVQPGTKLNSGDEVEVKADQEVVAEEPAKEDEVVAEEDLKKKVEDAITEEPEAKEDEVVAESSEEEVAPEINVEEDVEALLQGEELSEEFQAKAKTIFEAAINSKVATIKEDLEKENSKKLEEEIESKKLELTERVDSYLEYVAGEWLQENELAVEAGLKTEMTESFLEGMKSLFEEHYVSIPEDKYDVLENMVNKLDEMEGKLNEQIENNVALNKRLAESKSDGILSDVAEGLAITQKEKLASLAESVEFESEQNYREKLVTLRESYFPSTAPSAQRDNNEVLSEGTESPVKNTGSMANYLSTLQRVAKK